MNLLLGNLHTLVDSTTAEEQSWLKEYLVFKETIFNPYKRRYEEKVTNLFDAPRCTFPSGYTRTVMEQARAQGFTVTVLDARVKPCGPDLTQDLEWLNHHPAANIDPITHQREAVEALWKRTRGVIKVPTGGGKTSIASGIGKSLRCNWLFFVHRTDLLQQSADAFERYTGEKAGRVGDGIFEPARFTVAMFQTIHAGLKSRNPKIMKLLNDAQGIMPDECFPAGTRVGARAIEDIKPGDWVPSYDTRFDAWVKRKVLRVFEHPPRGLVRVRFKSSREAPIICTPNHKWWTPEGWCTAEELAGRDVLCRHYAHTEDGGDGVPLVPTTSAAQWETWARAGSTQHGVLLGAMRPPLEERSFNEGWVAAFERQRRAYEARQPDIEAWGTAKDREEAARARQLAPTAPRHQHSGTYRAPAPPCEGPGLADGGAGAALPVGHRERPVEGGGRGGRGDSLREGEDRRREEGSLSPWVRVDRVEVLQPGSDGTFGRVCPTGTVFNLEVAGTNTYRVGPGFVVSNCHTLGAESLWEVAMATPNAYYRIGLSGTPLQRGDKRSTFVVAALGPMIYRVSSKDLQEIGVLATPKIEFHVVQQKAERPTWQGVYSENIANSVVRNRKLLEITKLATKPCLVFVNQLAHGRILMKLFSRKGIKCDFISGKESTAQRRAAIETLLRRDISVLIVNVIFQEGVDIPDLQSVVIATGGASAIAALQRIGRGMRATKTKTTFEVYDILDKGCGCTRKTKHTDPENYHAGCQWLDKHTKERMAAYREEEHEWVVVDDSDLLSRSTQK